MTHLIKYNLDYNLTWKYVKDSLDEANILSKAILDLLNFKNGNFFTLLPFGANTTRISNFEEGLILPQNPEKKYLVNEHTTTYSVIPTIKNEISTFILSKIQSKKNLSCIFDDILRSPEDKNYNGLFDKFGVTCEEEVYYFLSKNIISKDLIVECLRASNAFWHSLGVLTDVNLDNKIFRRISIKELQEIGSKAKMLIIGAYDGEGYVFWESAD